MPNPVYRLFRDAILGRKQITCYYQGLYRECARTSSATSTGKRPR